MDGSPQDLLGAMCRRADVATQALLHADLVVAEQVISAHDHTTAVNTAAQQKAFALLALQAPVAGELRAVAGAEQIAANGTV